VDRSPIYFDLIEALGQPGCALCRLVLRDVHRYLDSLLYEYVNEPETNETFRKMRGLCNEHSWQLRQFKGSVLGIAILYEAVLDEVLNTLDGATVRPSSRLARLLGAGGEFSGAALAERLEPEAPCLACRVLEQGETRYVKLLSDHAADTRVEHALRHSEGLCLPHFRQALRAASGSDNVGLLTAIQRAIWSKLRDDLNLFMTKYDAQHAGEPMGEEGISWQRAIAQMAGEKNAFGQRRK
jgi:hypothetical protein